MTKGERKNCINIVCSHGYTKKIAIAATDTIAALLDEKKDEQHIISMAVSMAFLMQQWSETQVVKRKENDDDKKS